MNAAKNSFATVAQQIINYNVNTLSLLTQLNSLMNSNDGSVEVDYTDGNQVTTTFELPSWGYLQKEIQRMNENINSLFNINENGALIQTAENVWRKIILVDLNKEPNQIHSLNGISNFESSRNHFFDGLLNPSLKINIDLTGKVEDDVRQALVRRYIVEFERNDDNTLTNNGQTALISFNSEYLNRIDVAIDDFLEWHTTTPGVLSAQTPYFDEEKFQLEPNQLLYDGYFSVLKTEEDQINRKLWFHLNTLDYSVNATNDVRQLNEGDQLLINRQQTSTLYKILELSTADSSPKIRVERIQGNETIPVGESTLKIYSQLLLISKSK